MVRSKTKLNTLPTRQWRNATYSHLEILKLKFVMTIAYLQFHIADETASTAIKVYQTLKDSECLLLYQYDAVDDAWVYKYKLRRQGDAPKVAMTTGDWTSAPHRTATDRRLTEGHARFSSECVIPTHTNGLVMNTHDISDYLACSPSSYMSCPIAPYVMEPIYNSFTR